MDGVTVCVGTYGDDSWVHLAQRAITSARDQGVPVIHVHDKTLARARNAALHDADTEFVVFLDADDELEPGYIEALARGSADIRAPAVRYVKPDGRSRDAHVPRVAGHRHECTGDCLPSGNFIVIGAMVRTALLREAGGFREEPIYEDWSAWLRMWANGATIESVPGAVYRAHARPDSRNRAPSMVFKNAWHHRIAEHALRRKEAA